MATAYKIKKSVGLNGQNDKDDVLVVQTLFQKFYTPPEPGDPKVDLTGIFDGLTFAAIWGFQSMFLSKPDGKIDPGGTTFNRLIAAMELDLTPLPTPGASYYSYSSGDRQWGTAATIAAIKSVCDAFVVKKPGVLVGVGDISFRLGTYMSPHDTHRKGRNIDIRPIRKDGAQSPVTIDDDQYDRDATKILVELLRANSNVYSILFNDTEIKNVSWHEGHHNHLHVTMKT